MAADPRTRMPPKMVPSDLNPDLEPPPTRSDDDDDYEDGSNDEVSSSPEEEVEQDETDAVVAEYRGGDDNKDQNKDAHNEPLKSEPLLPANDVLSADSQKLKIEAPVEIFVPAFDTVAWGYVRGFPWMPIYVCHPMRLKPSLKVLGKRHAKILEEAKETTESQRIAYFFGSHNLYVHTSSAYCSFTVSIYLARLQKSYWPYI